MDGVDREEHERDSLNNISTEGKSMVLPKIEERTLYPPLINYLQSIGFKAVGETKVITKHPDILFKVNSVSFVVEVKIGKPDIGLKAVAQASGYAGKLGTQNIVILIYPEKYKNQVIYDVDIVEKIALNEDVDVLLLTEYWTESLKDTPAKIFQALKTSILLKKITINFNTVVTLIENYVRDLNSIIYQIKTEELVAEVVNKLDLFSSIGEIKDKETAKKQVMNLASYLLFNQLLFYHIYKRKTNSSKLNELQEITKVRDLQNYFDAITDIDYQSIYMTNILGHIPEKPVVVETLNEVIKSIKLLRAEHITHDLAGRFFHDLIPFEVRKVLAAFYTHPVAAEILAGLTIDSWNETVIDPACGSGTLLVSAYKRKRELYEKLYGFKDLDKIHKKFIEGDITGIDIMPFAAHITTLNLATQDIEQETNIVRIATRDSLPLSYSLKTKDFKTKGIKISSYTEEIQQALFKMEKVEVPKRKKALVAKREGALSLRGKGEEFYLNPVDVVIMNPPFSDREKMPEYMRKKIKSNKTLGDICGNQVNLWGFFLALADDLIKEGGKIGAVIPINIARGKATEKIRTFLFNNYHVKTLIKPVGDFAFSESSSFKDVLFIVKKSKPKKEDLSTIVFLKKSIRDMDLDEGREVVEKIKNVEPKEGKILENEYFSLKVVRQSELNKKIDNLMLFIGGTDFKNIDTLREFVDVVTNIGASRLSNLESSTLKEGITSPAGLGQLVYITRPLDDSRIERSFLILRKHNEKLVAKIKDTDISLEIPKSKTKPALRTLTGVKNIDITKKSDFIVIDEYEDFKVAKAISKWKGKFNWEIINDKIKRLGESRLVIPDKIRLSSKNTAVLSAYSENPLVLSNLFFTYKDLDKDKCKILSLSLNSIVTLAQFITLKSETLGGYIRLSANDWNLTFQLDYEKLKDRERNVLLKLFNKIQNIEFPSILEQLESKFWARVELDKIILKTLGFSDKEIDEWLPKVYDILVKELKAEKRMES